MTDREILRGTQNILKHSENHQQVFAKRNQRIRGKKEEPFHEDTLMIEDKDRNAPGYGGRSSPIPFTVARQVSCYEKFDAFELDDISYLKLRYLKLLPL